MDSLKCLSRSEAGDLARQCVENGFVVITRHAKQRLIERGFTTLDVERVLAKGCVYKAPEFDIKFREWKYRLEGKTVDDEELILVICFKPQPAAFVITVFPDDR